MGPSLPIESQVKPDQIAWTQVFPLAYSPCELCFALAQMCEKPGFVAQSAVGLLIQVS